MKLTAAQIIVKYLINEKIPYVLGIFGHGNIQLGEALWEHRDKIRYIQVKNEQNAVHIATAYAKMTGQPLAVTTSVGPGTTNLVTGAGAAYANKLPVLLLPGCVFAQRMGPVLQQIEGRHTADEMASDTLKPVSRYWFRVTRPDQLRQELPRAFEAMLRPGQQGPATICLPMDVQAESYDYDMDVLLQPRDQNWGRIAPDEKAVKRAANAIYKAKRPLILAGGGVIYSQAWDKVNALAQFICAPVVQTHAGNGTMLWDDDLNAYAIGPDGSLCGNNLAEKADLVIGIGTRYTDFTTRSETLFGKDAQFININICPFDVGKQRAVKLWGDADTAINMIFLEFSQWELFSAELREYFWKERFEYYEEIAQERKKWQRIVKEVTHERANPMTQARVIGVLNDFTDEKAVMVSAAGSLPGHLLRFWKTKDPTRKGYHLEYGYSTMGYEIPGGMGIKLSDPARDVYVMVGDATFLMQPQELVTAVQEGIAITVLVIDNGGPQVIRNLQKGTGFREFGNELRFRDRHGMLEGDYMPIDYKKIAQGMGVPATRVGNPIELERALQKAKNIKNRPYLIHVKVEQGKKFPPGYNSWWDVPRPEVSNKKEMQEHLAEYKKMKKKQVIR